MKTIHAVYENGVFVPTEQAELPESCEVEFEPRLVGPDAAAAQKLAKIYQIASRRYDSGPSDVPARPRAP